MNDIILQSNSNPELDRFFKTVGWFDTETASKELHPKPVYEPDEATGLCAYCGHLLSDFEGIDNALLIPLVRYDNKLYFLQVHGGCVKDITPEDMNRSFALVSKFALSNVAQA